MTVLPVFIRGNSDLPSGPGVDLGHAGSALLLSPRLALTCDHVIRAHPEWMTSDPLNPEQVVLGTERHRVARIVPSAGQGTDDLALLHLESPLPCVPPVFSEQWLLDDLYAQGFRYPPFRNMERDGPLTLEERSMVASVPRQVRAAYGLPKGFSGGPLTGTFQGRPYCVAINWRGGDGTATSVFIPAAACVRFVHEHVPGACQLVNLAPVALADFLMREEQSMRHAPSERTLLIANRRFCIPDLPITEVSGINRPAFERLALGTLPSSLAVPLNAWELLDFLSRTPETDPEEMVCRFAASRPYPLRMTETLAACLEAGVCSFVIRGYERNGMARLDPFLNRLKDTQPRQHGSS